MNQKRQSIIVVSVCNLCVSKAYEETDTVLHLHAKRAPSYFSVSQLVLMDDMGACSSSQNVS